MTLCEALISILSNKGCVFRRAAAEKAGTANHALVSDPGGELDTCHSVFRSAAFR
jgi:hypothetical protein